MLPRLRKHSGDDMEGTCYVGGVVALIKWGTISLLKLSLPGQVLVAIGFVQM